MTSEGLGQVVGRIEEVCRPVSIFLYGSRARDDYLQVSDWEVGVLVNEKERLKLSAAREAVGGERYSVFPFDYERFVRGEVDTPFQTEIYLRELKQGARTIRGKKVVEEMELGPVTVLHLLQEVRFNIGYALAALMTKRKGVDTLASWLLYKSCLYGTRSYLACKTGKVVSSYDDIYRRAEELGVGDFQDVVKLAYGVRAREKRVGERPYYRNIKYLNTWVEDELLRVYKEKGDVKMVESVKGGEGDES